VDLVSPPRKELILFEKNRELGLFVRFCSGETPSQVIESGSEVMEHVANEHEQEIGWFLPIDNPRTEKARWNILLSDNFVGADLQKGSDLVVQGLQVFVCPDELHGEASYCRHEVHSAQGNALERKPTTGIADLRA